MNLRKRLHDDYILSLKHRPKTLEEMVLPSSVYNILNAFMEDENIPNIMLNGIRGTGKTTCAFIMAEKLGREVIYINASEQTGVDTLRDDIKDFVTSCSFDGEKKIVILDEFDRATPQFQDSAKVSFEEYAKNASFILITNHKHRITDELDSRLQVINFIFEDEEAKQAKIKFIKRCQSILEEENIKYDIKIVAALVKEKFPDMRKVLNDLQKLHKQKLLTDYTKYRKTSDTAEQFFTLIRSKDSGGYRRFALNISDIRGFYRNIFDSCSDYVHSSNINEFYILTHDFMVRAKDVDHVINISAFMATVAMNIELKEI